MKIALAQINSSLLDFKFNSLKIIELINRANQAQADIILFSESVLFGYPAQDLLEFSELVKEQNKYFNLILKNIPQGIGVIFGLVTKNKKSLGRPYHNSAVFLVKGSKPKFFHKALLPTGDVFDESRFFEKGNMNDNVLRYKGKNILVTICEDIWAWPDKKGHSIYSENPLLKIKKSKKIDLVLNLSASPYYPQKLSKRIELAENTSRLFKAPFLFCNSVGAQDEIIFDGQSFALDKTSKLIHMLTAFEEDFSIVDLAKTIKQISKPKTKITDYVELKKALVLGIRDFCIKTGLSKVHLGLSGGVDSALVTCLAVEALGADKVKAFALPTKFSSEKSLLLAKQLSENLKIDFVEFSIQSWFENIEKDFNSFFDVSQFGLVHENLQARIRGLFLMAYANKENSLLLSTSNKSEATVGYATLYGDMCGGLMPIADLTKNQVYKICEVYNKTKEVIPTEILTRAPSAELRPNQKDSDSLPEYALLDQQVESIIGESSLQKSELSSWTFKQMMKTEFKRWQSPPILKVSKHAFGRGRRWPIAKKI